MYYSFKKGEYTHMVNGVTGEVTKRSNLKVDEILETFIVSIININDSKYVEIWSDEFHSNVLVKIRPF